MKRPLLIAYLILLHAALALLLVKTDAIDRAAVRLGVREAPPPPIIAIMREVHGQMDASVPEGATIFLGDSITMALATAAIAPNAVNYGIGYQRSDQLIESMRDYASLHRAGLVVVTIGTNDLLQGRADGIEARYRAILSAIPTHIPVVMSSPPPLARFSTAATRDAAKAACEGRKQCVFVNADLVGGDGLLTDGVHLSPLGYQRWIAALVEAIKFQAQP